MPKLNIAQQTFNSSQRTWKQYQKLLKRVRAGIKNGRFYQLSATRQRQYYAKLKRYIKRLSNSNFSPKKIALGTALLASLLTSTTGFAQNYVQPPCSNSLGFVDVGSNAYPVFGDLDGDGVQDAYVGNNNGNILFFQNTGTTTNPNFVANTVNNPFAGFDVGSNATPFFADIDGDGDLDAFVGNKSGTIYFYENNPVAGMPVFTELNNTNPLNPLSGVDVGTVSSANFVDIDNDGDLDAFIPGNQPFGSGGGGKINFFRNDGTSIAPVFTPIVGAGNPLDFAPVGADPLISFVDQDGDGDLDLFVGSQLGMIQYYENTGNVSNPTYVLAPDSENPLSGVDAGRNAALIPNPCFIDINGDGNMDFFIGSMDGVVNYFENAPSLICDDFIYQKITGSESPSDGIDVGANSAPEFIDIDRDGDQDLFVGDDSGNVNFFRNDGTAATPNFVPITGASNPFDGVDVGDIASLDFVDIDLDGDLDAFIGEDAGGIYFYQNNGTNSNPNYQAVIGAANPFNGLPTGNLSSPAFGDIDNDGDIDAFIGNANGEILFFRNDGTNSAPNFVQYNNNANPFFGVNLDSNFAPALADIDQDGDLDALIGNKAGTLLYFRNDGTAASPKFVGLYGDCNPFHNALPVLTAGDEYTTPTFVDIDNDGQLEVFTGQFSGQLCFLKNNIQRLVVVKKQVPTMNQWGLLVFGLLILNMGLIFLRQLEKLKRR